MNADNPYMVILFRPRAIIRAIVDRDPHFRVILLVLIAAAAASIIIIMTPNPTAFTIGARPIGTFTLAKWKMMKTAFAVLSLVLAIPLLYLQGALFRWA